MQQIDLILELLRAHKEQMNERLESIDENLREHMRRTDVLEQLHRDNQERIAMLEEPRKALNLGKNVLIWIASASGALITIMKLMEKL